jgi:23S rRNA (adenine2030-N6)-methyltransferase
MIYNLINSKLSIKSMLSYRHSFHAGNFADVLKHLTQSLIIESLKQKNKPFVYFDTHAGAGCYNLKESKSQKTGEYKQGINKIWNDNQIPELFSPYIHAIKQLNKDNQLHFYPGSPLLAKLLMPKPNRLELSELHPTDIKLLQQEFSKDRSVAIKQIDGYLNLKAKLPPIQRRGLILIDPPYELKTEYDDVIKGVKQAYKLFATGIYAIWYPVISRQPIERFCQKFKNSGIRNILRIEMCIKKDQQEYGMTGSGMIIINPPWKLAQQMQQTLPWLLEKLKQDQQASFLVEQLVAE